MSNAFTSRALPGARGASPIGLGEGGGTGGTGEAALSVTEFTRRVKELLEGGLRPGWVRGEISNLRAQASGHLYFSLKDAGATVAAVLFRGDAARAGGVALRDGQQVIVFGGISVYEPRGQYQLIVRAVVEDGVGRLQREFEALKQRLAAEGLFDPARKRPLPRLPRTIGFITSPTGAAVQDFLRILRRRGWRGRVVVLPAKVQGEGAAAELVAMLALAAGGPDLARATGAPPGPAVVGGGGVLRFDLLVIGRGGGSLEDLWAFNEEPLVRAVAACPVPVISAVGHEIDFTLCDFAADVRAETPSAAAELISSHFLACVEGVQAAGRKLALAVARRQERTVARVQHARSRLRLLSPRAQIERGALRLDDLANRLAAAARQVLQRHRRGLAEQRAALAHQSPEWRVQLESQRLLALWKRLQSASPASVLQRGFVIVRDAQGAPVARRAGLVPGGAITLEFADGASPARAGAGGDDVGGNAGGGLAPAGALPTSPAAREVTPRRRRKPLASLSPPTPTPTATPTPPSAPPLAPSSAAYPPPAAELPASSVPPGSAAGPAPDTGAGAGR